MDDQEETAFLRREVDRLRTRERDLSMALARAPRPGEKVRDGEGYATWFWTTRYEAIHGVACRWFQEPESHAATFTERRKPRR